MTGLPASATARTVGLASLAVVAGGALWGLFWIPVRHFETLGLGGAWPGLVIYLAALALLLPFALRLPRPAASLQQLALVGLLTGTAFAFYSSAILLTDVLRAILFFYLTPVWGTLIGWLFLGERLSAARFVAILLAFAGLFAMMGFGSRAAFNLGDLLALLSGVSWAIGATFIFRLGSVHAVHLSMTFLVGAILVTVLLVALGGPTLGPAISLPPAAQFWPYVLLAGLFAVPMILLTLWPAQFLTPGRLGLLLMSEVVVGIASVAFLAGEPFGLFEMLGATLILAAALTEVLGNTASEA